MTLHPTWMHDHVNGPHLSASRYSMIRFTVKGGHASDGEHTNLGSNTSSLSAAFVMLFVAGPQWQGGPFPPTP
jgi:hypothetical protein